jgi:integrase
MLDGLFNAGRLDVLRAIQKGTYTLLQVYEFYRINELEKLPTAQTMGELETAFKAWIEDKECGDAHKRSLHQSLRHLLSVAKRTPAIADLPELLEDLRVQMRKEAHAPSFNRAKAAVQAFVKSKLKKNHPLYHSVGAVEGMQEKRQREGNRLTVQEFNALCVKLSSDDRLIAEAMAYTGMGWTEYNGRWELKSDRVLIHGTKRKGRERFVPKVGNPQRIERGYKSFRLELAKASGNRVTPYDLRRTYATWLEDAEIPRTRRKLYMGHGARDVTDLYERREVERFLSADSEKLSRFIGATEAPLLRLEKKA